MIERAAQFTITLAQLNPTVGDIAGNAAKARGARAQAHAEGADLVVLSELFIAGYPPEDLVLKPAFQSACRAAIEGLARETADGGPAMLIGTPWVEDGKLYNACALLDEGRIAALRFKANLPNYGVFDEKRVFARGPAAGPVTIRGVRVGVPICEDTWLEESEDYENVVACLAETGAEI
jgi:NAD+ synthase